MSTLKNTVASLFVMAGMAGAPDAEAGPVREPITDCKPSEVFERFRTATGFRDFGADGCVYNVTGGRSFAILNYNMNEERGAMQFSRDIDSAARVEDMLVSREQQASLREAQAAERAAANQRRHEENQARRSRAQSANCERGIVRVLGSILDGRKPKDSTVLREAHNCTF
ncbi:MAG: hypothetical protein ACRBB3_08535 [Alphaproteobacteria bacterium]